MCVSVCVGMCVRCERVCVCVGGGYVACVLVSHLSP